MLEKITHPADFAAAEARLETTLRTRMATGFDVHRLEVGEELWLGGVLIPHDKGLSGHSDADVALHAITDAHATPAAPIASGRMTCARSDTSDALRHGLPCGWAAIPAVAVSASQVAASARFIMTPDPPGLARLPPPARQCLRRVR